MRIRALFFLAASAGLLVFSAWVGYIEFRPYLQASIADPGIVDAKIVGEPATALSIQSQHLALIRCKDEAMSLTARLQPSTVRRPTMQACLDMADRIALGSPTHAFAYLVGAMAAYELGDLSGMRERLSKSHEFAPTEQWIAQGRVALAERARLRHGDQELAFEPSDLALLVYSLNGIRAIAGLYVSNPAFRVRITDVVETLSERDQQRFVEWVTLAVQEGQR